MPAPIVLFTYNRLWHTQKTIEALLRNPLAKNSELIVYSDAARNAENADDVAAVREYLSSISGFWSLSIVLRDKNFGLATSIIHGVTEVLTKYDCVIVLEDDLVTSPYFLSYMNEALERFKEDERVISIHGYVYPVTPLPEAFFLPGADCWGWATWRRGWELFNPDGEYLLRKLRCHKLEKAFDFNGSYGYTNMLIDQIAGVNDSWAIRWYASAFLQEKLTLYPGRSLVRNIGNDSSGTHCNASTSFDVELSTSPVSLDSIEVKSCNMARNQFEFYFRRGKIRRLVGSFLKIGKSVVLKISAFKS